MGRPKKQPTSKALGIIRKAGEDGALESHVFKKIGIDYRTWKRWLREIPEVQEAWQQSRLEEHDDLVDGLRLAAKEGNITAAIFLLKARHGLRDGGPGQVDPENPTERGKTIKKTITQMEEVTIVESS